MTTRTIRSINDYCHEIHQWAGEKGWLKPALCKVRGFHVSRDFGRTTIYEPPNVTSSQVHLILAKLALVVEEVGEAVTEARHGRWGILEDRLVTTIGGVPSDERFVPYHRTTTKVGNPIKPEGFIVELADIVIRVMQLSEALGLPLQEAIEVKLAYNKTREYRHGGKKA